MKIRLITRGKIYKGMILGLILTVLCFCSSVSTYAGSRSQSGILNNTNVYASLNRGQTSASASTTSASSIMGHTVRVEVWYYYTVNGITKKTSKVASAQNHVSVSANASGSGQDVATYGAISDHTVSYNGVTWTAKLRDPSGFGL